MSNADDEMARHYENEPPRCQATRVPRGSRTTQKCSRREGHLGEHSWGKIPAQDLKRVPGIATPAGILYTKDELEQARIADRERVLREEFEPWRKKVEAAGGAKMFDRFWDHAACQYGIAAGRMTPEELLVRVAEAAAKEMLSRIRASVQPESAGMDVEIGKAIDERCRAAADDALEKAGKHFDDRGMAYLAMRIRALKGKLGEGK